MSDPIPPAGSHPDIAISSPLTVIGIFIAILREHFTAVANNNPPLKWAWEDDVKTTQIFVESGFNENIEARNVRPGLWVDRLQTVYEKYVIGDQDQMPEVRETGLMQFWGLAETDISIDCTSKNRGESMYIASIVQDFLHMSANVIQAYFGFRDMLPIIMNRTEPYNKDRTLMNTQIQFRVQYELRWATLPITQVLSGVAMKLVGVSNPDIYFRDMTLKTDN